MAGFRKFWLSTTWKTGDNGVERRLCTACVPGRGTESAVTRDTAGRSEMAVAR